MPVTLPVVFPFQLSSVDPDGSVESCRLLDDRLREIHYQIALLLGLPMDTNLTGPIAFNGSILGSLSQDSRWVDVTHFRLSALQVMTADSNNQIKLHTAPADQTVSIASAGPVANGRDQPGAFGANTFVHFYWIYNPSTTTLAGIASLTDPVSGGPTLPSGYLLGAYAGALRIGTTSDQLLQANIRGRWTVYKDQQLVLNSTTTGTGLPIDFSAVMPSAATAMRINFLLSGAAGGPLQTATLYDGAGDLATVVTLDTPIAQVNGFMCEVANFGTLLTYDLPNVGRVGARLALAAIAFENANAG